VTSQRSHDYRVETCRHSEAIVVNLTTNVIVAAIIAALRRLAPLQALLLLLPLFLAIMTLVFHLMA
jgi:hypothetical protein